MKMCAKCGDLIFRKLTREYLVGDYECKGCGAKSRDATEARKRWLQSKELVKRAASQ